MEDFQKVRLEKDLAELKKLIDTHFAQVCHGLGPNQGFEDGLSRIRVRTVPIRGRIVSLLPYHGPLARKTHQSIGQPIHFSA